jgi:hypothetical protein
VKSIFLDRDFETGADEPPITDGRSHELPSSSSDSASEVDWEFFLREDGMLPASNWEDEFLKHKARMMDHYGYKGIIEDDPEQAPQAPGEPENKPWDPCDPKKILDAEMEGVVITSPLEEQIKICYGMVSRFFFFAICTAINQGPRIGSSHMSADPQSPSQSASTSTSAPVARPNNSDCHTDARGTRYLHIHGLL